MSGRKQYAQWNRDEFDPDTLVDRLEKLRKPDPAGGQGIAFEGNFIFDDGITILERAIDFKVIVPERDQRIIVRNALFAAAESRPLSAGSLLGEVNRRTRAFAEAAEKECLLATSLSVPYFEELGESEYKVSKCRITIDYQLPEPLRVGHKIAKERMRGFVFGEYPELGSSSLRSYAAVYASVRGRSEFESASRALEALDLLRGMWNLSLNRRTWRRTTNGRRRPINEVLLGPVHSLHSPDGSLASGVDWYEYDYVEPIRSKKFREHWERTKREENGIQACLARNAYRSKLEDALRKYTRALDTREWDSGFVLMWGLLEDLTGTRPGESHDATVKRAAFLYSESERDLHVQVLNHLRGYRNASVHRGEGSEDIETYLYQLKRYVEDALKFHLENSYGFSSIEEAARFLDQPPELENLDRKISDLQREVEKTQEKIRLAELARQFHGQQC